LESKLDELNISSDDEEAAEPTVGKPEAVQQLEEELVALNASRKLLD
jgi:hypothetical protein